MRSILLLVLLLTSTPSLAAVVNVSPSQDLGDVIKSVEMAGVSTQINIMPGVYKECDIDIARPVQIYMMGAGASETVIECETNKTNDRVILITGQDASSKISIRNLGIKFKNTNTKGVPAAILINQKNNVSLTKEQVNIQDVNIDTESNDILVGLMTYNIAPTIRNVRATCKSSSPVSDVKCGWIMFGQSQTIDNLEGFVFDSYFKSIGSVNSAAQSARGLSVYKDFGSGNKRSIVNIINTVGIGSTSSGGESLGCYCVNDSFNMSDTLVCNYYGGVCRGDGETGSRRAFRVTATHDAPVNANIYGTIASGNPNLSTLLQIYGENTKVPLKPIITEAR